jgi:hypothetical protein
MNLEPPEGASAEEKDPTGHINHGGNGVLLGNRLLDDSQRRNRGTS